MHLAAGGLPAVNPAALYASYIGGAKTDVVAAVATDAEGFLWIAGHTSSSDLPVTSTAVATEPKGGREAFIMKLDPRASGPSSLVYATYFGGTGDDDPVAMVVRGDTVFLAGTTTSTDLPTAGNAYDKEIGGNRDAFVVKINTLVGGTDGIVYSSYAGGEDNEFTYALAVDSAERMYITGYTVSITAFPLSSNPLQGSNRGGYEAFLTVLDTTVSSGSSLVYSTYLGGTSTDIATGIALDASGKVWLTGQTMSTDFPVTGGSYQATYRDKGDIFVTRLDITKSGLDALDYSTYFGGEDFETPYAIAIDPAGNVCLTGYTMSSEFPVTSNAFQQTFAGLADVFVVKFDFSTAPGTLLYSSYVGGSSADVAYALAVDAAGKLYVTGYTVSDDFPVAGIPLQQGIPDVADAYVFIIDPSAIGVDSLVWSTYFGGGGTVGYGLALDNSNGLEVAGLTISTALPITSSALNPAPLGNEDSFVMKVDLAAGQPSGALSRNEGIALPRMPDRMMSVAR